MPSGLTVLLRLIWAASSLIALFAYDHNTTKRRYQWWGGYLVVNICLAPFYWPEIDGWYDDFWHVVLAISVVRLFVGLEAIRLQTEDCRHWWALAGGVFSFATVITAVVWRLHGGPLRDIGIQLRRYDQIWIGAAFLLTWGVLWTVGGLRWRWQDKHSAIIGLLCLAHAATSFVAIDGYKVDWTLVDQWTTGADATLYLGWAIAAARHATTADQSRLKVRIARQSDAP